MTLEVSGLEQVDQPVTAEEILSPEESTARAVPELDATISGSAREQRALCEEVVPPLPDHVQQYLTAHCNEAQLPFALHEAAQLDSADLNDPDIAELLLPDCIKAAEITAIDAETASETARADQANSSADAEAARNAERRTTHEGLSNEVSSKEGLARLIQTDPSLRDLRGSALLDALAGRNEVTSDPKLTQYIAGLRATLSQMRSVVTNPQERAAFETILSTANLNLGAASQQGVFINVLTQIESSDQISEETKANIRASMGMPQVNTGSQAQDILRETRVDEQGRTVPVWTEKQPLNIRDGVSMHSDPNMRQIMRAEFNGHITEIDTTGWSGEVVGKYLEAMSFIRDVESYGGTGLFQSIYKIDFNLTGEEGFDAHKVDQILNIMGKWFGGFEHADGDVRQNGERRGFIRYVVRLLNKRGTATGFEESQADSNEVLMELGLRNKDGSPNWLQIDRMGDFARSTYMSGDAGFEDLKAHLVGGEPNELNDAA